MTHFQTTRWSLIQTARNDPAHARPALEQLCRAYRPPVLAYVRRHGHGPAEAEDLTQEFFARFLERGWYASADPARGRFRALLLTALRRFLCDQRARALAEKRGGGVRVDDDDVAAIADDGESPEQAFTRVWVGTVLGHAIARLQSEWVAAGKLEQFEQLAPLLVEGDDGDGLRTLAAGSGLRGNTLAVRLHRMRQRLRQLVRLELVHTVGSREALEQELADLRGLARPASG
jgi:RNA polymerase sigma-70 factor (ECF subfamily)